MTRICFNSAIDGHLMEKCLVPNMGSNKVASIAANNGSGRAVVTFWSEAVKNKGGRVVLSEYHTPGEINFSPSLTKISTSGADSIIITSDPQTASHRKLSSSRREPMPVSEGQEFFQGHHVPQQLFPR